MSYPYHVAVQHFAFLVLEMFLWNHPIGRKIFSMRTEKAKATRVLAANQGLYNGFLAVGLLWGLVHPDPEFSNQLLLFFLSSVVIAGAYGGYTVKRSIFFIQSLPAVVGVVLVGLKMF
ncbi:MAG: DUF1304 domain-containing protein [Candidatus Thiodiazotropha sp.]